MKNMGLRLFVFILFIAGILPFSASGTTAPEPRQLQVELTYISEAGEGLRVDWQHHIHWIWRPTVFEDKDVESPFAQLWIALPEQFSDLKVNQESVWVKSNSENSPFSKRKEISRVLLVETQSPIRTIPFELKKADGKVQKAALRVRFIGTRGGILRHKGCDEADASPVHPEQIQSFFFVGQYCGFDPLGHRINLLWPSLDAAAYDEATQEIKRRTAISLAAEGTSQVTLYNLATSQRAKIEFESSLEGTPASERVQQSRAQKWRATKNQKGHRVDLALFTNLRELEGWADFTRGVLGSGGRWRAGLMTGLAPIDKDCCWPRVQIYYGYEVPLLEKERSILFGGLGLTYTHLLRDDSAHNFAGLGVWARLVTSGVVPALKNLEFRYIKGLEDGLKSAHGSAHLLAGFDALSNKWGEIEIIGGIKSTNSKFSSNEGYSVLLGARIVR